MSASVFSWTLCRFWEMEAGSVVRAVFEFLPSVSEELPLFTGDVIEVLSVLDEFWLLGNKDGVTGKRSRISLSNYPLTVLCRPLHFPWAYVEGSRCILGNMCQNVHLLSPPPPKKIPLDGSFLKAECLLRWERGFPRRGSRAGKSAWTSWSVPEKQAGPENLPQVAWCIYTEVKQNYEMMCCSVLQLLPPCLLPLTFR